MQQQTKLPVLDSLQMYEQEIAVLTGDQVFQQMKRQDQFLRTVQAKIALLNKEAQKRADRLDAQAQATAGGIVD